MTDISVRSQRGGKRGSSRSRSQERRGRNNSMATALGSSSAWKVELDRGKPGSRGSSRPSAGPTQEVCAAHSLHGGSWPGGLGAGPHLSGEECGFLMGSTYCKGLTDDPSVRTRTGFIPVHLVFSVLLQSCCAVPMAVGCCGWRKAPAPGWSDRRTRTW